MTVTTRMCPACGVVAPGRRGPCPSCGAAGSARPGRIAIVLLAVTCAAALAAWGLTPARKPASGLSAQVIPGNFGYSADRRGTDAAATIENSNPVAVDVTVRVRGFDITNRAVAEQTLRPYRNIPPGGTRPIRAYFDMTPLRNVVFEVVEVIPFRP